MKEHVDRAFELLTVAYPTWGDRFTAQSIELWGELVDDIPPDELVPAVNRVIRRSRFAPSIADIFEAAGVKPPEPPIYDEFEAV